MGDGPEAKKLIEEINARPYLGYKLKTVYSNQVKDFKKLEEKVKIAPIKSDFFQKLKREKIDILIIAETLKANSQITKTLYQGLEARIDFWDLAKAYEIICGKIPISFVSKTWFLENLKEGEKAFYDKLKRIFDLVFVSLLTLLSSPLWAIIALAIKLEDKGDIFYKQKRVGKDRKEFVLIKFRSMKPNAEKKGEAKWAGKNDKRTTKIGKILRRTHLDELPQSLNVFKGDLSLVGPRPERPEFVKKLNNKIPHYHLRHLIKPGVTGWDQIKFRYARTMLDSFEKFQYDLYYLKNRKLFLDFGILLKTFQSFFRKTD